MSVLRRPDDHHRNVRRRAPCAFISAEPDQDRHFMTTITVLPASQRRSASLPTARRALSSQPPQTLFKRRAHASPSHARDRTRSSSSLPPITLGASGPRSHECDPPATFKSPRSRPTKPRPFLPAVSSLRGFRTPAPRRAPRACKGPASETLQHCGHPPGWLGAAEIPPSGPTNRVPWV